MATTEGIAVGLSSGTAICTGMKLGIDINDASKKVLIIVPSAAERHLSTELFDNKSQSLFELPNLYGKPEVNEPNVQYKPEINNNKQQNGQQELTCSSINS